ncbi:hypothetical protein L804_03938 [Cryptococcus deuterogattii 2001/935-1]|nr:hypothetical protein L804_03938 [Cryptococcus deuterogattii 2001/935-1]
MPRRLSRLSHSLTPLLLLLFLLVRYTHAQYIPPQASDSLWRRDGGDVGFRDERSMGKRQGNDSRSLYLVSHTDFCLFGPPSPLSSDNTSTSISQINRDVVSWCTVPRRGQDGEDQRRIPDGTLNGVTYVKANSWVQVSGTGDFTKLNIPAGDQGAQFDSVENTPDGAVLYLTDDQIASSWVVSLPVS